MRGDEAALYHIQRNYVCLDMHLTSDANVLNLGKFGYEGRHLLLRHCANTRDVIIMCMTKLHM